MSLHVNFGITSDPVNCANKTFTSIKPVEGNATEPENILNPSFVLDYDKDLIPCNYCYIQEWDRYYFCKTVLQNGSSIRIICSSDAVRSFWYDYISKQPLTIVRSTSFEAPTYIQDGMFPVDDSRTAKPIIAYFDTIHDNLGNADFYDVVNTL